MGLLLRGGEAGRKKVKRRGREGGRAGEPKRKGGG